MMVNEKIVLKVKVEIEKNNETLFIYDVDGVQVIFLNTNHYINSKNTEYAFCGTIYNKHIDNKGLPHLTEHCIFGGSKNFDMPEPFEHLVQNEKYNYINAITFRDRTACLFSSYDGESFNNIMEVYLDAIFNPLLNESTFKQECFREDTLVDGTKTKNGIAYNEMLDMYSNLDYQKENEMVSLFNRTYFKYNAHGKPGDIEQTSYTDVVNYYKSTYTKDNIQLAFYGNFCDGKITQEQILNKILEISKETPKETPKETSKKTSKETLYNTKSNLHKNTQKSNLEILNTEFLVPNNDKYEINVECSNNELNIVIAFESLDVLEENLTAILLETIFTKQNISKKLYVNSEILDVNFKIDNSSKAALIKVAIKTRHELDKIQSEDVLKFIYLSMANFNNEIFKNIKENIINTLINIKIKDYGYKTQGIYNLLEISKLNSSFIEFNLLNYKNKVENLPITETLERIIISFKTELLEKLNKKIHNLQKNDSFVLNLKKNQEKFDKLFKNSTKYDIIDIIIIIKFNNLIKKCVKSFNINGLHNFKSSKKFIILNQNIVCLSSENNEIYVNLSVYSENSQTSLENIIDILQNSNLVDLISFENDEILSSNSSNENIFEIMEYELKLLNNKLKTGNKTNEIASCEQKSNKVSWEMYVYNNGDFSKNAFGESLFQDESFGNNNRFKLKTEQNLETQENVVCKEENIMCKEENIYKEISSEKSKLYKNILLLDISNTKVNDYFYIELLLEALINERLLKKIRLENGAYEVNYKLFKLENKVVIYSNIDKYSEQTLEIFKQEVNNLNQLSSSAIKKYSNKLTNNFYRNEQNKSIKIQKDFVNYITGYRVDNENIVESKIAEAIEILQNAKIVLEKSYN